MAKMWGKLPSEIVGIETEYEKFCFDEVCTVIRIKLEDGEIPQFNKTKENHFSKFSDFYDSLGTVN